MDAIKAVFRVSLFIIIYSYVGYGTLLYLIVVLKRMLFPKKAVSSLAFEPPVALVISAFNEEDFISLKIKNTLELNYPADKMNIIFITDGSTDRTPDIIRTYDNVTLMHQPERKGKSAAMNRAMLSVKEPIVMFSDANTLINKEGVHEMVKHFADGKVGGVAGEKRISSFADSNATSGEGLYWKYESFLKRLDSEVYSVVGAAGELFAIRTALYEFLDESIIIEDFVLSMRLCIRGYKIRYEPNAFAIETGSESMKDEQIRKVRIGAGAFQAMGMLKELFNVVRYPVLSFQYISHRVLRWTLSPVCLVLLLFTNVIIVIFQTNSFYTFLLAGQVIFYFLAAVGWIYANKNIRIKALYVPYYFLFMNVSVFIGFNRFRKKQQDVLWEKAGRRIKN